MTIRNLFLILGGNGALARNPRSNFLLFSAANTSFARFLFFPRCDCLRGPRPSRRGKHFYRRHHFPRRLVAHRTRRQPPDPRGRSASLAVRLQQCHFSSLENDRPAAILTTGSAIFSTANSRALAIHVAAAIIRPNTDLPTIGQLTVPNPREVLVKSVRASLRLAVDDDVREIPEGAAYRIVLDSSAAEPEPQGPRGAGTKGHRSLPPPPIKEPKFIWVPISFAIIETVWGVHEALRKPRPSLTPFPHLPPYEENQDAFPM
ncbi:MAG: hypothetical protein AUI12_05595 [Acidobacteria bacterium 13_2_20CM_2_57_6]|nr:MAG: hypothetical protein AUI12_05595 [Acidobacteria bacterium 13_2_20CM_2_57_6]PYT40596.1 MAG: hypothetical protein DMG47_18815 [Acidobacteriota bacterium]PYT41850.1 MAG: hypothetical protein DMG45_11665 [Acidobacteriota bacterium]PYT55416.1 MAG: hypothetical protein DMG46_19895 [Acidobacteriota bacterium]